MRSLARKSKCRAPCESLNRASVTLSTFQLHLPRALLRIVLPGPLFLSPRVCRFVLSLVPRFSAACAGGGGRRQRCARVSGGRERLPMCAASRFSFRSPSLFL